MPAGSPTPGDLHVDAALTNVSLAFAQSASKFVADKVFPIVPVAKQSDKYHKFSQEDFYRDEMALRPPGQESAGTGFSVSTDSYFADEWGLHIPVSDQQVANADPAAPPDRAATTKLTQAGMIRKDRLWATSFFGTSIWTGDQTGVAAAPGANQFLQFDQAASNPIDTVLLNKDTVEGRTGFLPNVMVVGVDVHRVLKDHADIKDAIKYTQRASVTAEILAALFEVDEYIVARGIYASNVEGATAAYSRTVGAKAALLVYRNPAPAIMEPSGGYTFSWSGLLGVNAFGTRIRRFRVEPKKSDIVEIEMAFEHKLVSADLGVFLTAAVA